MKDFFKGGGGQMFGSHDAFNIQYLLTIPKLQRNTGILLEYEEYFG